MKTLLIFGLLTVFGLFFRFWHIEFGLPHSFTADEPEIAELAIKYTYEIKSIIANNDWYKLVPVSYVYGMFPAYLLTAAVMLFSKTFGILHFTFEKMDLYVFMRSLTAFFSFLLVPVISYLYFKLFKDKLGTFVTFFLLALNWKLIVHAHYVNADIFITLLLSLSFLTLFLYQQKKSDTLFTILTAVFYGLAVGTKITALLTLPLYLFIFWKKKDYRSLFAFCFIIFAAFIISNPFSLIFVQDFVYRIYEMKIKEAGLVFDSVDTNPFKYLIALTYMITPVVLLFSLYGNFVAFKKGEGRKNPFHMFLLGNVIFYILFYSIQSRRVDRWLLPILPIVLLYASYGFSTFWHTKTIKNLYKYVAVILAMFSYLYFPALLLFQFQANTPKSAAYLWMQKNTPVAANKLVYTEEGLDPMNKLLGVRVFKYNVYESEVAQFFLPEDPLGYNYVVLSSRPMENFKRKEVRQKYPFYAKYWDNFEATVNDKTKFELVKSFTLPKPNLIPLSDVFIYENKTLRVL